MTKKKILYMYAAATAFSAIIFILSLGMSFRNTPAVVNEIIVTTTEEAGYVLGVYEDRLALFRSGSDIPYKKLDYNISMLTEYDRIQVLEGIYLKTEAELNALIEDLTS